IDHDALPRPPSEYFHGNVSVCLVYDEFGASQIEHIGVDRVLAEADYPHPDSQWPNTRKILDEQLAHLSPGDRRKVLRTNAERLFPLDLAQACPSRSRGSSPTPPARPISSPSRSPPSGRSRPAPRASASPTCPRRRWRSPSRSSDGPRGTSTRRPAA